MEGAGAGRGGVGVRGRDPEAIDRISGMIPGLRGWIIHLVYNACLYKKLKEKKSMIDS